MSIDQQIKARCRAHQEEIVAIRRDLHQYPEVGFEVQRTAGIVAAELKKCGLQVREQIGKTGVVADLEVPGAERRIALRADMDALPMQEEGSPPYKSRIDGKAHMCGHDAHTAMLIGAARVLSELRSQLKANVRFVFQPNEEALPGGAPAMIQDGVLEGVDEIFGLHVWPAIESGKISICKGAALAQPDVFDVIIQGIGGHAATPQDTVDPIVLAAQWVNQIQTIVSRNIPPLDSAVVSVTQFHAGTADNVIPREVALKGTVRTYKKEIQRQIRQQLKNSLSALTNASGAAFRFNYLEGYPVCYNHGSAVDRALTAARDIAGRENVVYPGIPTLGGEDFAYYTEKIPGCFVFLGVRNQAKGTVYMLHDPRFDLDEDCMVEGMRLHSTLAMGFE